MALGRLYMESVGEDDDDGAAHSNVDAGYGGGRRRSRRVEPPLALTQREPHFGHVDRYLYVAYPSVYALLHIDAFLARKHVHFPRIGLM